MGSFQDAIANAFDSLQCAAGQDVTYHRGTQWTRATAVPGRTDFQVDDGNGVVVEYRTRDFIFKSCDLYFGDGTEVVPQRGDLIKETVRGQKHVHEVLRPDGSEQVWRYSDHGRAAIRVHTKFKGVE